MNTNNHKNNDLIINNKKAKKGSEKSLIHDRWYLMSLYNLISF
jgi:hypothetical protein